MCHFNNFTLFKLFTLRTAFSCFDTVVEILSNSGASEKGNQKLAYGNVKSFCQN